MRAGETDVRVRGSRKTFWGSNGCCQSVTVSGGGRKEGRKGLPWPRASIARGGASARKVGRNSAGEKDARRNFLWSLAAAAAKEGLVPRSTLKTLLLHLAPIPPLLSHCTVGLASRDACCQKPARSTAAASSVGGKLVNGSRVGQVGPVDSFAQVRDLDPS